MPIPGFFVSGKSETHTLQGTFNRPCVSGNPYPGAAYFHVNTHAEQSVDHIHKFRRRPRRGLRVKGSSHVLVNVFQAFPCSRKLCLHVLEFTGCIPVRVVIGMQLSGRFSICLFQLFSCFTVSKVSTHG